MQIAPSEDLIEDNLMAQKGAKSTTEEQKNAVSSIEIDSDIMNMFN